MFIVILTSIHTEHLQQCHVCILAANCGQMATTVAKVQLTVGLLHDAKLALWILTLLPSANTHQVLKKQVNVRWGGREKHEGREDDVLEGGEKDTLATTM